ncbi:MAG: hypothetical protein U5L09_08920 [Bacteroidales bacterium]|nr:hypothetical protein [Bacteroidales bacterium]
MHQSLIALPPIIVTAAFLWGQYSKNVYQNKSNEKVKIYLSGFNKADKYKESIYNKLNNNAIGIAYNKLNKIDEINQLITFFLQNLPEYKIIVRPHPGDNRQIKKQNGISTSLAKYESSLEYLTRIDYLVSGNSSILLEAAIMNVLPIQYTGFQNSKEYLNDYYGFIKQGVALPARNYSEIIDIIKYHKDKSENYRIRAKPYDASIGSAHEFNVEKYILNILKQEFNIY